ncbi:MAG: formate/nitrite transporter family protein [Planctomycetaceae bacterium]|nr:formate/nitrite transporter family protein [Planctomycetaceae bacterium]
MSSSPQEITQIVTESGISKAAKSFGSLFVLGILAGAYIAFASEGSTMAAFNLLAVPNTYGLGRCLAGAIFPGGLMLVIIAGGELFTGNTMMLLPLAKRKITLAALLRNWSIVYTGNFIGSVFVAYLIYCSGQLHAGNDILKSVTIQIAAAKCHYSFSEAFCLGILCNWLVCLAVWMAAGAKDTTGKIFAVFFPIWLFITSGFEHSVANMYYIPAGLFALNTPFTTNFPSEAVMLYKDAFVIALNHSHIIQTEMLPSLTWMNFFIANLIPVTLGNIVGGGIFTALAYGYCYRKA